MPCVPVHLESKYTPIVKYYQVTFKERTMGGNTEAIGLPPSVDTFSADFFFLSL